MYKLTIMKTVVRMCNTYHEHQKTTGLSHGPQRCWTGVWPSSTASGTL